MKKKIVFVFFMVITVIIFAQTKENETFVGIALDIQMLNISGSLDPNSGVSLVSSDIGATFGTIPKKIGFAAITSISIPIYNIIEGAIISGSGMCTNIFVGFGKSFYSKPLFTSDSELRNLLNLSAGFHSTIRTVIGKDMVLTALTGGPSFNMYMGGKDQRFRVNMTFWYDPIAYFMSNVPGFYGWANANLGFNTTFGLTI